MQVIRRWLLVSVALLYCGSSVAYERVISLAPHITELIYAIGAEDKLIATVNSSDYPPAANQLPRVGDGVSISAEALLAYAPDLVLAWQPTAQLQRLESVLAQSQITLQYIQPQSLTEIPQAALKLGQWLNRVEQAEQISAEWQQRIAQLPAPPPHTSALILLNIAPLYGLNEPMLNDVLRHCGLYNWIPADQPVMTAVTLEQLLQHPAQALISSDTLDKLALLLQLLEPFYSQPPHILFVNADHFYRAGPRLIEATEALCAQVQAQNEAQ